MWLFYKELIVYEVILYQLKLWGVILQVDGSLGGHSIFFPYFIYFLIKSFDSQKSRTSLDVWKVGNSRQRLKGEIIFRWQRLGP